MKLFNTPEAPSGTADLIASRSPPGQASSVRGAGGAIPTKIKEGSNNKQKHNKTQHTTKATNILAKKIKKEARKEGSTERRKAKRKR